MTRGYRFTDHTADFGLEIYGADPRALFEQAAVALSDLITDPATVTEQQADTVEVSGDDWADLMVNWLRELLYRWNGEDKLMGGVTVTVIDQTGLCATVTGEPYDANRHEIRNEIKAVTYHQIEVGPFEDGWRARLVLDI